MRATYEPFGLATPTRGNDVLNKQVCIYILRALATTNETNEPYPFTRDLVLLGYNVVSYKLREYGRNVRDAKNGGSSSTSFSSARFRPTRSDAPSATYYYNSSYNTQPTGQAVGDARSVRKRVRRNALEVVIDGTTQSPSEIVSLRDVHHQDKSR